MNQKNSTKNSSSESEFNFDDYLKEQAEGGDFNQINAEPKIKRAKGSFLRNTLAIFLIFVIGLLYFNDWNPNLVYGNIFGQEEIQVLGSNVNSSIEEQRALAEINQREALEKLRLAELKGLENIGTIGMDAQEISNIQKEAIQSAFEGLKELEHLEELSNLNELIGQSLQVGLSEALTEINKLDFGELIAFETFKVSLEEQNLLQEMPEKSLKELFDADVTVSFIKDYSSKQNQDDLTVSTIIEAFDNENN